MQVGELYRTAKQKFSFLLAGGILLILFAIATAYYIELKSSILFTHPKSTKGFFDFSALDLENNFVSLEGNAEFYWKQLLEPKDFKDSIIQYTPQYLDLESSWNNLIFNNNKVGGNGYGTYRFKIKVSKPGIYCIKIKEFETAFDIWINSKHYSSAGKVGTSKESMVPNWKRQEYPFYSATDTIEVILHISNFHHRMGGAVQPIIFGSSSSVDKLTHMRLGLETFIIGILIILILYHLTLYYYCNDNQSVLYFSLACIFILFRLVLTGEKLILEIFPFITWDFSLRLEYITNVMIVPSLVMYFYHLLPKIIPSWLKKSVIIISAAMVIMDLILPSIWVTYTIFIFIGLCYYSTILTFIFIVKAVFSKHQDAILIFSGALLLGIVVLNDLLVYTNNINSTYLLPYGLTMLLLTQAFIISKTNSLNYKMVKILSSELEFHAKELENIVLKRTQKLNEQKIKIGKQKKKIEKQNQKLIKLDNYKKDMTKMLIHDLKTPLNNIIGFLQLPEITPEYKELMQSSGYDLLHMIHNILDVTKYENTELKVFHKPLLIKQIIDAAYNQNKYNIKSKSITFENLVPDTLELNIDEDLIERVFVNIISNATKFKNENGLIRVSSEIYTNVEQVYCKIKIFNTGETIPTEKLDTIYNSYNQIHSPRGEYKDSTGLGLTFCKMAVEAHQGTIGVDSTENEGVTFWFTIPMDLDLN